MRVSLSRNRNATGFIIAGVIVGLLIFFLVWLGMRKHWSVPHITGYSLFVLMLALASLKVRKRLLVLPIGTVRDWMLLHLVFGVLGIALYFQHTGTLWPSGRYEQWIAFFFYLVTISGVSGYVFQRAFPQRLADLGEQVIFERIPVEMAALRERVEALMLEATRETGSDTLARYYAESLHWYFERPRFALSHLRGTGRSEGWIQTHLKVLSRFLNESERAYLVKLEEIALRKSGLDAHHALQGALKLWLFVHVPCAVLLLLLASWHLLIVHIYAR